MNLADVHSISLVVLMQKARIQIWLFEQKDLRIEGRIIVSIHFAFGVLASVY